MPAGASSASPSSSKRARPASDDVELLVVAALLGVLLDHLVAGVAAVGVDAERAQPEGVADGMPAARRRRRSGPGRRCEGSGKASAAAYAASAIRTASASTIALPASAVHDARRRRQPVVQRRARPGERELPAQRGRARRRARTRLGPRGRRRDRRQPGDQRREVGDGRRVDRRQRDEARVHAGGRAARVRRAVGDGGGGAAPQRREPEHRDAGEHGRAHELQRVLVRRQQRWRPRRPPPRRRRRRASRRWPRRPPPRRRAGSRRACRGRRPSRRSRRAGSRRPTRRASPATSGSSMPRVVARAAALSPARPGSNCDNRGMDAIDREILGALMRNGRISYRDLGAAVGLSANAAADRVRRLRRDGVITGFTATVDQGAAGRGLVALIDVRLAAAGTNEAFEEAMRQARAGDRRRPRDRAASTTSCASRAATPPSSTGCCATSSARAASRRPTRASCSGARSTRHAVRVLVSLGVPLASIGDSFSSFFDAVGDFAANLAAVNWLALLLGMAIFIGYLTLRARASFHILRAAYPEERIEFRNIWGAYLAGYGFNSRRPGARRRRRAPVPDEDVGAELELPGGRLVVRRRADLRPHDGDPDPALRVHPGRVPEAAGLLRRCRPSTSRSSPRTRASRCSCSPRWRSRALVAFALLSARVRAFWERVRQGLTILQDRRRYFREVWLVQLARLGPALHGVLVPALRVQRRRLGAERAARARRQRGRGARAVHAGRRGRAAGAAREGLRRHARRARRSPPTRSGSRSRSPRRRSPAASRRSSSSSGSGRSRR